MLINSETAPSTLIDSNIEDDSTTVTSAPNATSNEPIKIILFPPKDKQFCYDEQSNSFQVQSLPTTKFAIDANLGGETSDLQRNLTPEQSTLTPLIEKCNLLTEERDFDGFRQQSQSDLNWCDTIREVLKIENAFNQSKLRKNCFLKGCKWSPDGLCLLSNSDDNFLRLFEISENLIKNPHDVQPVLQMKEGGTIYDFEWYPGMNSSDPISCV